MTDPYGALYSLQYEWIVAPAVLAAGRAAFALAGPRAPAHTREGGEVLDVGCGGGQHLAELGALRPDLRLSAVDNSRAQAEKAQAHLGNRAKVTLASAERLPFEDHRFDHVYAFGSIKHWPDRVGGLRECLRVLRPGGTLLLMEANRDASEADARAFARRTRTPPPGRPVSAFFLRRLILSRSLGPHDIAGLLAPLPVTVTLPPREVPGHPVWVTSVSTRG